MTSLMYSIPDTCQMLSRRELWQSPSRDSTTAAASIDCPFQNTHATTLLMLSGKAVYTPNKHRLAEGQHLVAVRV